MEEFKSKIQKESEVLKKEFIEKTATWIMAGFGLVAALAWNEAIKSLFDAILGPSKTSLIAEFIEKTVTWILAGFGLVAALAWNEAIKSLFDTILGPSRTSLIAKFIYAIIVTVTAVFISRRLMGLTKEKE